MVTPISLLYLKNQMVLSQNGETDLNAAGAYFLFCHGCGDHIDIGDMYE